MRTGTKSDGLPHCPVLSSPFMPRALIVLVLSLPLLVLPLPLVVLSLPLLVLPLSCWAQPPQQEMPQYPSPPTEGDWIAHDFVFQSGEKLAELRLHYTTLGTPARDGAGRVRNAVIVMHGTGGSGRP